MPLYEYACARCGKSFEEIVYDASKTPACPTCAQQDQVERVMFGAVSVGKKESFRPPNIKSRLRPPR
ncbi:MAG: zinc ribbon domain-containing protein [Polyangiales bacterium]